MNDAGTAMLTGDCSECRGLAAGTPYEGLVGMALYKLEELAAYQVALDLKAQIIGLIYNSPAQHDVRFVAQISDAVASIASNVAEGHDRYNPAEFAVFVKYARGSLREVVTRLPDGVAKRHYSQEDIDPILATAQRLTKVLAGLYFSLLRQANKKRAERKERSKQR